MQSPHERIDEIGEDLQLNMEALERSTALAGIFDDQLNRAAVELELSQETIRDNVAQGLMASYKVAGMAGKAGWALLKKTAVLSYHGFQKTTTVLRTNLDRSGSYDLQHTEKLLHSASDGSGTFIDKSLAHDLQLKGKLAGDYNEVVNEILQVNRHVLDHVVSQSSSTITKLSDLWAEKEGTTRDQAQAMLVTSAKVLADEPRVETLIGPHSAFVWPGGYHLMSFAKTRELKVSVRDHNAMELVKRLREGRHDIALKHRDDSRAVSVTVPVLSKHEAQEICKSVLKLIHQNQFLLELMEAKQPAQFNPKLVPNEVDALIHFHVSHSAAENAAAHAAKGTDDLEKIIVSYMGHFRYLNGRTVLTGLFNRNLETIRTLLRWVRASVKHYS